MKNFRINTELLDRKEMYVFEADGKLRFAV